MVAFAQPAKIAIIGQPQEVSLQHAATILSIQTAPEACTLAKTFVLPVECTMTIAMTAAPTFSVGCAPPAKMLVS